MYHSDYLTIRLAVTLLRESFTLLGKNAVPLSRGHLVFFIDLPFFIYIALKFTPVRNWLRGIDSRIRHGVFIAAGLILAAAYFVSAMKTPLSAQMKVHRKADFIYTYGTLIFQVYNLFDSYNLQDHISPIGPVISGGNSDKKQSYILIQVEALDANVINVLNRNRPITPFLRKLRNRSVCYPYTMVFHKGGGTSDAEVSIINSRETMDDQVAINLAVDYPNSVAKKLKRHNYTTYAFHGNSGQYYNRLQAFKFMGFDEFFDFYRMGLREKGWGAPDGDVFDYVLATLKKQKGPFFYYIITMSSHGPYHSVPQYYKPARPFKGVSAMERKYLTSISYVDQQLERFVRAVRSISDCYIIIYGDHPDLYVPAEQQSFPRSLTLHDGIAYKFVPLYILTPDNSRYLEKRLCASFLDIAPTILQTSGCSFSIKTYGKNLLRYPLANDTVPYMGSSFNRRELHGMIADTARKNTKKKSGAH